MLEALDGRSAMKLCGEGFMIAGRKDEHGHWDWRTFGSGEGFTADAIVAGYLSADRIEANTITANKLAADVGQSLDLSSNRSISLVVESAVDDTVQSAIDNALGYRLEIETTRGSVLSELVPSTALVARVWRGSTEVTEQIPASRFVWTRTSRDGMADDTWNAAHCGTKQVAVGTSDIYFSATYRCDILSEDET